jgi:dTDP-4-dehydrorhamnose reductase
MPAVRRIVIIAPHGLLGQAWMQALGDVPDVVLLPLARAQLNLTNPSSFERILGELDFDVLVNCAAYTAVDDCEVQGELAYLVNGTAPGLLGKIAARRGARMLHFSSDFVFDGKKPTGDSYAETDQPHPISVYGKSKLAGEEAVLNADTNHVVIRLSWLFGSGRPSFPEWLLSKARQAEVVEVVSDKWAVPTHAGTAAADLLPWLEHSKTTEGGIVHYNNPQPCSWIQYAQGVLDAARELGEELPAKELRPISLDSLHGLAASRPRNSILATDFYQRVAQRPPKEWKACLREHFERVG